MLNSNKTEQWRTNRRPISRKATKRIARICKKMPETNPCGTCSNKVEDNGNFCEGECARWFHPSCGKLSQDEYKRLSVSSDPWSCELCRTFLPCSAGRACSVRSLSPETSCAGAVYLFEKVSHTEKIEKIFLKYFLADAEVKR